MTSSRNCRTPFEAKKKKKSRKLFVRIHKKIKTVTDVFISNAYENLTLNDPHNGSRLRLVWFTEYFNRTHELNDTRTNKLLRRISDEYVLKLEGGSKLCGISLRLMFLRRTIFSKTNAVYLCCPTRVDRLILF